jgi:sulfotransferase
MKLHAIAGLPRAGSTLLCNILSQRPETVATSTSCLPGFVRNLSLVASNRVEMKNLLNRDLARTQHRFASSVRAFCQQWHAAHNAAVVFDKSRGWNNLPLAFRDISPEGVIILCVRDLRDVFASIEREETKNGLITTAPAGINARYEEAFSPNGVVGGSYNSIMALVNSMPSNVHVVRYEDLINSPEAVLLGIEKRCGLVHFDHDLNNIPDLAIDCDGFYLGKFPHRAAGKLRREGPKWQDTVPLHIANDIVVKAQGFYQYFEYRTEQPVNMQQSLQSEKSEEIKSTPPKATDNIPEYKGDGSCKDPANYT